MMQLHLWVMVKEVDAGSKVVTEEQSFYRNSKYGAGY